MTKFFKRAAAFVLAAVMICAIMPAFTHAVTSTAHVSISVSPKELAQEGNVTVSITLTNTNSSSTPVNPTTPPSTTHTPAPTTAPTDVPVTHAPTPEPIETPAPTDPPEGHGSIDFGEPSRGAAPMEPERSSGSGDYTGITITNSYGVSFQTQGVTVAPGASKTFSSTMHVSSGMIGVDLPFTVSWTDRGQHKSDTVTCKISRLNASPYLSVVRTANPINASEGTEVTITYTFTNSGSVRLTNITLVDRYVKGSTSPLISPFSLDPGATKEYVHTLTMGNSTIVSQPVITFYAQGSSTQLTKNVSALTIGLIQSQLTKEIQKGTATPEGVPFTLWLTNNGNQKLSSLVVKDELGNSVSTEPFSLAVGETKKLEYFVPNPETVRYVVFSIEGYDYNNTEFKDNTASYVVRPYIDMSLLGLSFTAVTTTSLSEASVIGIEFTFENTGSMEFHNLSVTEKELDYELYTLDSLAVGATEKANVEVNIGEVRELVFVLTAEDPSGNPHTHEAYVTADQIDYDALIPADDPSQGDSIEVVNDEAGLGKMLDGLITSTGEKLMAWFRVLGIIAVVTALTMLGLGVAEIVIRRNKRQKSAEQ
ncbi:MAG: hypothetical protein IKG85_04465 [Clostridia bacterium]|nr:hypothetical protein [Clostridia bacterium]